MIRRRGNFRRSRLCLLSCRRLGSSRHPRLPQPRLRRPVGYRRAPAPPALLDRDLLDPRLGLRETRRFSTGLQGAGCWTLPQRNGPARKRGCLFPAAYFSFEKGVCLRFLGSATQVGQNHSAKVRSVIIIIFFQRQLHT